MVNATGLPRTAVVGVLGGGQLGKMMGQEAVSGGGAECGERATALHRPVCWNVEQYRQAKLSSSLRAYR